ncbi:FAD-dependent oxidoreductase [Paenibacillus chungangensis]|uniref:FAD-dependent oxidoreductase n=1 Tax=Paenibacillus chungangensis TaxID=696535 RepID=A0ABW3HKZ7_9BACL
MSKKVIIVGGVAGGASAAARLRRLDESADIIMLERGEFVSFANCGLPYYIGGTIQERSKLLVQTPESLKARFRIDVRTFSEAVSIDPERKMIKIESRDRGAYEESYDDLILSPGAKPIRPSIPGIDNPSIHTLRNIADTDRIKELVDREATRSAVVVGGGYIGVEMAENLRERGLDVTLVEAAPHILAPFDSEMVVLAEKELEEHGVRLRLNSPVQAFRVAEGGIGTVVELGNGDSVTADIVILAIGVMPDTGFLQGSGIQMGARGHIIVNEHMETNQPSIYAVGDAVETTDFMHGGQTAVPLAGPANKQGRIAADRICGLDSSYKGTQGTAIIKVFGLTGASTGSNERTLNKLGVPYHAIYVHPISHAGYYPGAKPMSLKLLFNEQGRVLGAQAFGEEGVDKRIDVIATVIRLGGTVYDLTELELSYAPPYSSAKDPVNMAGYVAENVLEGRLDVLTVNELDGIDADAVQLLDVRTVAEYGRGHLDGALNIPVDDLRERLHELDRNKEIYAYCEVGLRGYIASRILSQHGFRVRNLTGGHKSCRIASFTPSLEE